MTISMGQGMLSKDGEITNIIQEKSTQIEVSDTVKHAIKREWRVKEFIFFISKIKFHWYKKIGIAQVRKKIYASY